MAHTIHQAAQRLPASKPPGNEETLCTRLERTAARRYHRIATLQTALPTLPPDAQLPALIELKSLRMADLQRRLRHDVTVERRLLLDCAPTTLLEWSRNVPLPQSRGKVGMGLTHRHNVGLAAALMPEGPMDDEQHQAAVRAVLTTRQRCVIGLQVGCVCQGESMQWLEGGHVPCGVEKISCAQES